MVVVVVVESNFLFLNLTLKMDLKASGLTGCVPGGPSDFPPVLRAGSTAGQDCVGGEGQENERIQTGVGHNGHSDN